MNILELSEQEIVRRQSLQTLRKDEDEPRQVVIAGRMMGRRVMGKASFAELQDSKGRIQVYIARDEICPDENKDLYNTVFKKLLDIGDFIGVKVSFSVHRLARFLFTPRSCACSPRV